MTALFNRENKWIVRDGDQEWQFDSFQEAQKQAADCTAAKFRAINSMVEDGKARRVI